MTTKHPHWRPVHTRDRWRHRELLLQIRRQPVPVGVIPPGSVLDWITHPSMRAAAGALRVRP